MIENIGAFDPWLLPYLGAPHIEVIKHVVANVFHLSIHDLEGPQKSQHIALARYVAMYLMRPVTSLSFPRIGIALHRNHSTIIHGYQIIVRRIEKEPAFAAMIQRLENECGREGAYYR